MRHSISAVYRCSAYPRSGPSALSYLILKSYSKYMIDRDIADNADKNRKKTAKSTQGTCNTLFTRDTYTNDNVIYIITCKPSNHPGSVRKLSLTIIISSE